MSKERGISESTIARMAGNIMSGMVGPGSTLATVADRGSVVTAVTLARLIAEEVEHTAPQEGGNERK